MGVYQQGESERVIGQALPPARLAAIWKTLNERERLGFIHSLTEDLADLVIELTYTPFETAEKETDHGEQCL